jgi:ribokinase
MAPSVAVVGGINVDLVFGAPRWPRAGETLNGTTFGVYPGGKGANQAVAAARAGGAVTMVGRLGDDAFGQTARRFLEADGVDLRYTTVDPQAGTGVAGIVVEPDGTNRIIVVPQANDRVSVEDAERAAPALRAAGVLLLQLEVPREASLLAARLARAGGATVVLNPAPAGDLPDELLPLVDVLVPNETEAGQLTGLPVETAEQAAVAGRALRARGVPAVVLTLGARGALLLDGSGEQRVAPFAVQVVDTTAAGDAFCGVLAVALAEGLSLPQAARRASAAGALATTRPGAGPSLPRREDVDRLLAGTT